MVNVHICARKGQVLVCENKTLWFLGQVLVCENKTLWFYQKVLWNWYQHAWLTTYLLYLADMFVNRNLHIYGYKLCSFCRLFLYSYEADFILGLLKNNVIPLNNSRLGDFVDHIYPTELEIKDIIDTAYLHLHLEIDSEGWLRMKLYDKRDDLNFPIVYFLFICSNTCIWSIYLSVDTIIQRLWSYQDFIDRGLLLTTKLLNQGFLLVKS